MKIDEINLKTHLTKEQSEHLISLGVPKELATGNNHIVIQSNYPIFSFTDLIKILPQEITYSSSYNRIIESSNRGHFAYYCGSDGQIGWRRANVTLIDSLYELLCYLITNQILGFTKPIDL